MYIFRSFVVDAETRGIGHAFHQETICVVYKTYSTFHFLFFQTVLCEQQQLLSKSFTVYSSGKC